MVPSVRLAALAALLLALAAVAAATTAPSTSESTSASPGTTTAKATDGGPTTTTKATTTTPTTTPTTTSSSSSSSSAFSCQLATLETCSGLGRAACVDDPNVCGPCLTGYVHKTAHSGGNSRCVVPERPFLRSRDNTVTLRVPPNGRFLLQSQFAADGDETDVFRLHSTLKELKTALSAHRSKLAAGLARHTAVKTKLEAAKAQLGAAEVKLARLGLQADAQAVETVQTALNADARLQMAAGAVDMKADAMSVLLSSRARKSALAQIRAMVEDGISRVDGVTAAESSKGSSAALNDVLAAKDSGDEDVEAARTALAGDVAGALGGWTQALDTLTGSGTATSLGNRVTGLQSEVLALDADLGLHVDADVHTMTTDAIAAAFTAVKNAMPALTAQLNTLGASKADKSVLTAVGDELAAQRSLVVSASSSLSAVSVRIGRIEAKLASLENALATTGAVDDVSDLVSSTSALLNNNVRPTHTTSSSSFSGYTTPTTNSINNLKTLLSATNSILSTVSSSTATVAENNGVNSILVGVNNERGATATINSRVANDLPNLVAGLRVQSAGYCVGHFMKFWIGNGAEQYRTGRGIRVILVNSVTLAYSERTFDTFAAVDQSYQLRDLLNAQSDGTIALMAAYDEATRSLEDGARNAIRNYGSEHIFNVVYRGSWAMIGIKGATPGTVPEDYSTGDGCDGNPGRRTEVLHDTVYSGKWADMSPYETYARAFGRE